MDKNYAKILENCESVDTSLCYIQDNICEAKYFLEQILRNFGEIKEKQRISTIQNKKEV